MFEVNRILLQLNRVIECANSTFPQDKGIAVILFDNLIEVQLYKKAERIFMRDSTTWYGGKRKFDVKQTRNETTRKNGRYEHLLKFSKTNKILDDNNLDILKYLHNIRNGVYHRGELNDLKLDLAIILYYGFLSKNLNNWGIYSQLICSPRDFPGFDEIDFGQGIASNHFLLDEKKYYNSALTAIFNRIEIKNNLAEQATYIVSEQLKRINWAIKFITKESKSINFYGVMAKYWYLNDDFHEYYIKNWKPKNIDSILILYSFLREHKDNLDDISNLTERQKQGKQQLIKYRQQFKGQYPYWTNLKKIEERIKKFKGSKENTLMQNLRGIEENLSKLYSDLDEAALDLDVHLQELSDLARGK